MFLVGILSWWYSAGIVRQFQAIRDRLSSLVDFFSIRLLVSTLFSPYKQIGAGQVIGSLDVQLRAFFDRTFSRLVGASVRIVVIIVGLIAMVSQIIFGFIAVLLWLIIPFLPVIGLIIMVLGWTPQWTI